MLKTRPILRRMPCFGSKAMIGERPALAAMFNLAAKVWRQDLGRHAPMISRDFAHLGVFVLCPPPQLDNCKQMNTLLRRKSIFLLTIRETISHRLDVFFYIQLLNDLSYHDNGGTSQLHLRSSF